MTEKLRALALAATPGPWMWDSDPIKADPLDRVRFRVVATGRTITQCYYSSIDNMAQKEAEWIAAANPTNILALLDEIDKLKAENAGLRKDAERYQLVRRGQHWAVIDGIGDSLRAESLDSAVDAAKGDSHE
jgi:hypothetical protein